MIASRMIALVVIATTAASVEMTGVPLVVAMPAAAARVLLVDVRLEEVGGAARVMIAASAANAGPTAEMDSTDAMIARRVNATRHHLLCRG